MPQKAAALKFVILLGFVSLCADATYEGARSITGAYLQVLGASGTVVDAIAALIFGYLFDRTGISILIVAAFLSSLFAPLVFLGNTQLALLGIAFWGIGMGAQESILKAAMPAAGYAYAGMVPKNKRATAYGIFSTGYGLSWFLGSALMGILYDRSITALIVFSSTTQLLAIPFFVWVKLHVNTSSSLPEAITSQDTV
ncbi:MAG: hypothetical protein HWQ35_10645 [Nostoc sp. NMS1]|uniref:MFS transporter n=1 Tax=unclassified Nostoc TaxID=2593658 RepID=UPI0025FD90E8|nr:MULTISPECIES: MFS transporter [unclassified Nostoc]MBN3906989.1 hypothetical protein [Nostoc sp. NMS1]MBN3992033.1 hypothetical protein [Nostoc sp. NMS2]